MKLKKQIELFNSAIQLKFVFEALSAVLLVQPKILPDKYITTEIKFKNINIQYKNVIIKNINRFNRMIYSLKWQR